MKFRVNGTPAPQGSKAGRAVSSTNDLSFTEAATVLAKLEGK